MVHNAAVMKLGLLVERSLITVDIVTQESFELHVLHHSISTKQVTEELDVFDLLINKVAHSQRMVGGGGCTSQIVVATLELTVGAVRVLRAHSRRVCHACAENTGRVC